MRLSSDYFDQPCDWIFGPTGAPMPMRDAEVNQILNRVQEGEDTPRTLIHFEIGEQVKINGGHFEGFDGNVEEVDDDNQRLKVTVSIFGRATPVELEFTQVSKQTERLAHNAQTARKGMWEAVSHA